MPLREESLSNKVDKAWIKAWSNARAIGVITLVVSIFANEFVFSTSLSFFYDIRKIEKTMKVIPSQLALLNFSLNLILNVKAVKNEATDIIERVKAGFIPL